MATRAKRPCRASSCAGYATNQGYCDKHQSRIKVADRARGTSHQRGYDHGWRKARLVHLAEHPLCLDCSKRGVISPADVVDHIQDHKGNQKLFWDRENWQSLCYSCHSRKTAASGRASWNPNHIPTPPDESVHEPEPEPEPVNTFRAGDEVRCITSVLQARLLCDADKVWTVQAIYCELVEVTDGNWSNTYHFSHFSKI